jgi:hypothetical protein
LEQRSCDLLQFQVAKIGIPVLCNQSWLGKFGRWDKWSFCLTAARMAAEQEKR